MKTAVGMNDPRIRRVVLAVAPPAATGVAASAGHHAIGLRQWLAILRPMHRADLLTNRHFIPDTRGTP